MATQGLVVAPTKSCFDLRMVTLSVHHLAYRLRTFVPATRYLSTEFVSQSTECWVQPSGVSATTQCAVQDELGAKYCALICTPGGGECGAAACVSVGGVGFCMYSDGAMNSTRI